MSAKLCLAILLLIALTSCPVTAFRSIGRSKLASSSAFRNSFTPRPSLAGDDILDTTYESSDVSELKRELLQAVVGTNRGFVYKDSEKTNILELVELIEQEKGFVNPLNDFAEGKSPLMGKWRLVYTTALDVLLLGINPLVSIGQIYQNIELPADPASSAEKVLITNVVELQPSLAPLLNSLMGPTVASLRVEAEGEILDGSRVELYFKKASYEPSKLLGTDITDSIKPLAFSFPTSSSERSAGVLDTTFCDDTMRIGRAASGGSIFVAVREY